MKAIRAMHPRFVILIGCAFLAANAFADTRPADLAEQRKTAQLRALIQDGVDVNAAQVDGMTALHWAVYHDDAESVRLLIKAGAKVDATNRFGVAPLSIACTNGNAAVVEMLLQAGADANTSLPGDETALMTAARTGTLRPVQLLLKSGAKVEAKDRRQQTALMWAAAEGHVDVVKELIRVGADFRKPLATGFTPLFFAVREGHLEVVAALLDSGADVNQAMKPTRSVSKGPQAGLSPLTLAVENGHFDLAAFLLKAGADPNDQRSDYTALHMLTWVRKPNRGDGDDGDPAPIGSGKMSSLQFVKVLVASGADVNTRLKKGRSGRGQLNLTGVTAFLMASKTADLEFMRLLLELGADPKIPNADDATSLMAAAGLGTRAPSEEAGTEEEAIQALKLLLKLGLDVNAVDKNGETAMHGAAYKSFPKVAALLAKADADIEVWNRKNKFGWTPVLIAEGHRSGNFKPSFETLKAIHQIMIDAGLTPPKPTPRVKRPGY